MGYSEKNDNYYLQSKIFHGENKIKMKTTNILHKEQIMISI